MYKSSPWKSKGVSQYSNYIFKHLIHVKEKRIGPNNDFFNPQALGILVTIKKQSIYLLHGNELIILIKAKHASQHKTFLA